VSYYRNKIIIITGATSGVGKSIAKMLQKEGARLFLIGRNFDSLKKELPTDQQVGFYAVNLSDDAEINKFVNQVNSSCDKIDILIHSAGVIDMGSIESLPVEKLDEQYRINTRVPYLLTQKLLPLIKKTKGQVVFFNSTAGLQTREYMGTYSASKFALKAIADSLRLEVRRDGVNVLSVFLGATATPMQEKVQDAMGKVFHAENFMNPDEIAERVLLAMQSGKVAGITDITIKDHNSANYLS
jgi:short-subunit dehydrogenase